MTRRALGLGFDDADAGLLVDHFVDAEMRGAEGHGVERLRWLAGRPALEPRTQLALAPVRTGLARYDAQGSLGYTALAAAFDAELATPPAGARVVVVGNCFPTGRLGYFAERAARHGLVCLLTATSTPRISHPSGGGPLLGTNPLCLAVPGEPEPGRDRRLDGPGHLRGSAEGDRDRIAAARRGCGDRRRRSDHRSERDRDGHRGRDAVRHDQAYKGFALALLVEVLCRSLAGEHGHAAVALLASPVAAPMDAISAAVGNRRMPGERSSQRFRATLARGELELPDDLLRWLEAV